MDESFDSVARAVLAAADGFPGLAEGERFAFASLDEQNGMDIFPRDGEVIREERRTVTGRVRRVCCWPFTVVCRAGGPGEDRRADMAGWMDALGRYLEGRKEYPALTGGRRLTAINRAGAPRQEERPADRTETWVMDMTARYEITI